ncbi:4-oxalocrotonate decarboxylase [Lentzea tibetensis]|uniref:4-oxalocrotonate decarboxylase n=1 Tax=Lentzea tibetensis TaxID=2591470 RepID=A0A563F284_9PSEU|nr:fumarylacetoacetate hydrolase family protein [Lentzea tibetensis]TWP53848.1 4-oxalocrotonate decarboxylase [Lentzea tibetensis]
MTLTDAKIRELALRLDGAELARDDIPSITGSVHFDIRDAYRIQSAVIGLREARGERITGVKLGFTSKAKMAQMGVSEVIVGHLTSAMLIPVDGVADLSRFIHPRVEPEIAYRLARDVDGTTPIESCVDAVAPAVEIIDSRYRDFRFTHADVVADNTSAAGYALGPWQPIGDVRDRAVRLSAGAARESGSTSAILGDPARALTALAEVARRRGIPLRAGYTVLAGAATAAIPLVAGAVVCRIDGLGSVSFTGRDR